MDERNRQNIMRASLGIRTSAEIFEASQREYEEGRARGETKRRRLRGPRDMQSNEAGVSNESRATSARAPGES